MPPNQPGQPDDYGHAGNREPHAGAETDHANPYFAGRQDAPPPDLDANAPFLATNEEQRLNRKALLFLAGIVVMLGVAAYFMFRGATSSEEVAKKPREERVVVPELPRSAVASTEGSEPEAQPIPLELQNVPPLPPESMQSMPPPLEMQQPQGPSLVERRIMDGGGADQSPPLQAGYPGAAPGGAAALAEPSPALSAQNINNPDTLLVEGTYIRCVLAMRIITDIPGFTSCVVTEPVYSINGRRLLLPKGSKILGRYDTDASGPRVAVIWDRIMTPNGLDINMANPGVDNLGGAGHPGDFNAHWGSRIASALMISLIADAFKWAAAEHGPQTSTIGAGGVVVQSPYESATARSMERLANDALDRSARRPATVTINQGTVLNVYVAQDVDFSHVLAGR
jgi:type IV secretion system protein VirB10